MCIDNCFYFVFGFVVDMKVSKVSTTWPRKMSFFLAHRFHLFASFTAVVLLGALYVFSLKELEAQARTKVHESLTTVLDTTHQAVKSWLNEHKSAAAIWANSAQVRQMSERLLDLANNSETLMLSAAQTKLRDWLLPICKVKGYQGYLIVGLDGITLGSSQNEDIGRGSVIFQDLELIEKVWFGETVVSLPQKSDVPLPDDKGGLRENAPTMLVSAPITDDSGITIALFAFRIDPAKDFTSMLQQGRIGSTGETYAFDATGRLISLSRFDDQLRDIGLLRPNEQAILNIQIRDPGVKLLQTQRTQRHNTQQPLTHMARHAVAGESGTNLDGYRDYRGIDVVGSWLWDADFALGITTELDASEAYQMLRSTQFIISTLTFFSGLLLIGLTAFYVINRNLVIDGEKRLRKIIDLVPSAIFVKDWSGRLLLANKATAQAYNTTVDELISIAPERLDALRDGLPHQLVEDRQVMENKQTKFIPEETVVDAHGKLRVYQTVKIPYVFSNQKQCAVLCVATDITERKLAEERLVELQTELAHAARLSMLGEMTASIAHEINQPLTVIYSYAKVCIRKLENGASDPGLLIDLLKNISTSAYRGGEIIRRLRAMVIKRKSRTELTDTCELMQEVMTLIKLDIRAGGFNIKLQIPHQLPYLVVDAVQIQQVMINLIRNAMDAMGHLAQENRLIIVRASIAANNWVKISVRDYGAGMSDEAEKHLFDPFFTTKDTGMGMGLKISKSIIEAQGGQLWFTKHRDQGTSFHFTVPTQVE